MSGPNALPPGSYRSNFAFPSGMGLVGTPDPRPGVAVGALLLAPLAAPIWQGRPWRILDLISSRLLGAEPGSLRNLKGIGTPNYRRATHESDGRPLPANEVPR